MRAALEPRVAGARRRLARARFPGSFRPRALALVSMLAAGGCCACPRPGWTPAPVSADGVDAAPVIADAECAASEPDCNVCAPQVVQQLSSGLWSGGKRSWAFHRTPGSDLSPYQAYSPLARGHVQGFVRLNQPGEAYAMAHSKGSRRYASVSFVSEGPRGGLDIAHLHRLDSEGGHTSGLFTLGQYVGVIERDGDVTLLDPSPSLADASPGRFRIALGAAVPGSPRDHGLSDWSGGVAMTRLADQTFLLVANQGGSGATSGQSHLIELTVPGGLPAGAARVDAREVGESAYPVDAAACADHHHSENLALLTECGSGHVYAVHVGSNDVTDDPVQAGVFHTFWRVSQLVERDGGMGLRPVGVFIRPANLELCHGRSAGSAFVDPETHRIELLCHERDQFLPRNGVWNFWRQQSGASIDERHGAGRLSRHSSERSR